MQPSTSSWASPIVLVKMKDGTTHFCMDYRKLNNMTRKDAYPLPHIIETLDALSSAKVLTTLDLARGYWQVEMSAANCNKIAFATCHGLFEFQVMPFGLCNAPETFQRLMEFIWCTWTTSSCMVKTSTNTLNGWQKCSGGSARQVLSRNHQSVACYDPGCRTLVM